MPAVRRLDRYDGTAEKAENIIVPVADDELDRLTLSLSIVPFGSDFTTARPLAALSYFPFFTLVLMRDRLRSPSPTELAEHFLYERPLIGLYDRQAVSEDEALIGFHQRLAGRGGVILYPPNAEGEWRMIFAVVARVAPELVRAEFHEPGLSIFETRKTAAMYRFKVRDQHGNIIKRPVAIKSLLLSAEL